MQRVSLTINGQTVGVPVGSTILDVARRQGIEIPTLCHFPSGKARAVCRICVVALADSGEMVPACSTLVEEGMEIETDCAAVIATRRILMEFILAEHGECGEPECVIERLAERLGVTATRFQSPQYVSSGNLSSDFVTVRPELCIHCDRCIQACGKDQQVLARAGRGATVAVAFDDDRSMANSSCTNCGDCVAVCPAGGLLQTL